MDKAYQPQTIEAKWYQHWEQAGYFKAKPTAQRDSYCIMLPPPNITGSLHMGHGFQCSLMDALVRYHRMHGYEVLWQPGTDHASIATQMVVERQLLQAGIKRHDLGREAFLERVWEWQQQSGGRITQQLRRMGCALDWSRQRFTMDSSYSQVVRDVFIQLFRAGLIYRGKRLVNWDPKFQTAISDLEVIASEEEGQLWHIRYPLTHSKESIVIATTRPETLLGDVAVAVHPDDARYQHLIGQHVQLPLCDRTIPIIADHYVDPEFGTGCVKITPAHDFNDYVVGQRHQLPQINILTADAKINSAAPKAYQGLDRFEARTQILNDLEQADLIVKVLSHTLNVPRGDRSGAIIEPYLTDQWYVKSTDLAARATQVVQQGKIRFVPENWTKIYYQWLNNIEDWCISRQLWWGHRIPAWYDDDANVYVGKDEHDVRQHYQLDADIPLHQDEDVLDTWFSSSLWPFATLGWPQQTPEFKKFYPSSVLVTGFDIIFFWVARMIMMGLKLTDTLPFHTVYITGLIRDASGHKMSKSKGNVLDPLDMIDGINLEDLIKKRTQGLMQPQKAKQIEHTTRKEFPDGIPAFGTDALRFTYCTLATTGRDIRFELNRVAGYRNFCNKIWNAARYVFMSIGKHPCSLTEQSSTLDRWIIARLHQTIHSVNRAFEQYRFDLAANSIYEFIWNEYCDWYLEFSKLQLKSEHVTIVAATRYTLVHVLEQILRVLHPLMPYITEEIWQRSKHYIPQSAESILLCAYPKYEAEKIDETAVAEVSWLQQIISAIRTIRSEMNIAPQQTISLYLRKGCPQDKELINQHDQTIKHLIKVTDIHWLGESSPIPVAATALVADLELLIPMAGLIDKDAETVRLTKVLAKHKKTLEQLEAKLNNAHFCQKAPPHLVTQEQTRQQQLTTIVKKITTQLEQLAQL